MVEGWPGLERQVTAFVSCHYTRTGDFRYSHPKSSMILSPHNKLTVRQLDLSFLVLLVSSGGKEVSKFPRKSCTSLIFIRVVARDL